MRNAIVRCRIVVEETIDMIQPTAVLFTCWFTDQPLNMTLAWNTGRFRDRLGGIAKSLVNDLGQPLEEKSTVDEDGDATNSHCRIPQNKNAPSFLRTLGIGERAYSLGADTGQCSRVVIPRQSPLVKSHTTEPACRPETLSPARGSCVMSLCTGTEIQMARILFRVEVVAAADVTERPGRTSASHSLSQIA